MVTRNFCFTLFNYTDDNLTTLKELYDSGRVRYLVYGKEVCPSTFNPHIQGFAIFAKTQRLSGAKKALPGCHIEERSKNSTNAQAADYCKKDGDFEEFGVLSEQGKRNDLLSIAKEIDNGTSLKEVAVQYPATYIRNYRGIANYQALSIEEYNHDTVRGRWLYGVPGVGKSHHARLFATANGTMYVKAQNKWFDGYAGEDSILLDDLDTNLLGHYLKIWADKWSCTGEIKGGTVKLQHKHFIVTSNYTPSDLWPDDLNMQKAIKRRFKMIHVTGLVEHLDQLT